MDDRIKLIRKKYKLNQTEFGLKIGKKQSTVAGYERGEEIPEVAILSVCKAFPDINETWLRSGEGDMEAIKAQDEGKRLADLMRGTNENKKKLIRIIADMPDELLDEMLTYLRKVVK